MTEKKRMHIEITGIVQGVGFRPFIHRLVTRFSLCGWIRNTSHGVELEAEGDAEQLARFPEAIRAEAPVLAYIESLRAEWMPEPAGYESFRILESERLQQRQTLISPDICICDDCRKELLTPGDRRYRYPFINCTNCGPRFTIVRDIPYDRKNTTMAPFAMCPDCSREYHDISDRRYHAQPDCCPVCGPSLSLLDAAGQPVSGDPIRQAAEWLAEGRILAVKGLGGIHLACRADLPELTARLRSRKRRDARPFALMCRDTETARRYCEISPEEAARLGSPQRPIVLLKKKEDFPLEGISENRYAGIMLPYTPVHVLLMEEGPDTLIMTSANLSDLPILYKNEEALQALSGIADGFLLHDREIETRCDDSLMWVLDGAPYPVRRSRGFVPYPVTVKHQGPEVLALGAEQKASFCLLQDSHAFLSQHIGDLKNGETLDAYETQIRHFEKLFDLHPQLLACDLHPDYLSTGYALERAAREGLPVMRIQHHHAHMAACMADNDLEGSCIGIIWDGTGLGPDGRIWGGEFLAGGYQDYCRMGSIRPILLPGGDRAVREPRRAGISLLLDAEAEAEKHFPAEEVRRIGAMLAAGLNCPASSGMGRLFDGAAAILGLCGTAAYEGQGAILLEAAADEEASSTYPAVLAEEAGLLLFDHRPMIRAMSRDLLDRRPLPQIAAAFLNTLMEMALQICCRIRSRTGLDRIVLSGGTFQNMFLMHRLPALLEENGFTVYHHSRVSVNDESISLGQAMIAGRGGERYVSCSSFTDR